MKTTTILTILLFSFSFPVTSGTKSTVSTSSFILEHNPCPLSLDIVDDIAIAIRSGNARELSKFFNKNVDLNIPENEGVYSKAQAQLILKDFFTKNPPKSFTILHQGSSKDGARYVIGNLTSEKATFRIYFYMRKVSDQYYIHEFSLSAEEEEE